MLIKIQRSSTEGISAESIGLRLYRSLEKLRRLCKHNNRVMYLLVTVDVLSRYLRVGCISAKKRAQYDCKAFEKIENPQKVHLRNVLSHEGTDFKGASKVLVKREREREREEYQQIQLPANRN